MRHDSRHAGGHIVLSSHYHIQPCHNTLSDKPTWLVHCVYLIVLRFEAMMERGVGKMEVIIRDEFGVSRTLHLDPDCTIESIQEQLREITGVARDTQACLFSPALLDFSFAHWVAVVVADIQRPTAVRTSHSTRL